MTERIPQRVPMFLDEGASWFGSRIENGWYVRYRVCASDAEVTIWMKHWESGNDEPDFSTEAYPPVP